MKNRSGFQVKSISNQLKLPSAISSHGIRMTFIQFSLSTLPVTACLSHERLPIFKQARQESTTFVTSNLYPALLISNRVTFLPVSGRTALNRPSRTCAPCAVGLFTRLQGWNVAYLFQIGRKNKCRINAAIEKMVVTMVFLIRQAMNSQQHSAKTDADQPVYNFILRQILRSLYNQPFT